MTHKCLISALISEIIVGFWFFFSNCVLVVFLPVISTKGYENGTSHSILISYLDLSKDCCKLLLKIVNYFFTELITSSDILETLFCGLIAFLLKLMAKFPSASPVEGKTSVLFTLLLKINRKFAW